MFAPIVRVFAKTFHREGRSNRTQKIIFRDGPVKRSREGDHYICATPSSMRPLNLTRRDRESLVRRIAIEIHFSEENLWQRKKMPHQAA